MSEFLPDGVGQQPPSGATEFTPNTPATTQEDVALMQRVLQAAATNPLMIPPDLMSYIVDFVQTSRLIIPIGQVFGFSGFTAQVAPTIGTGESTVSTSYTDLATVGPTLSGVGDGKYVVFFGCQGLVSTSGTAAAMVVQANSEALSDGDNAQTTSIGGSSSTMRAITKTLSNGGANTITAKYRCASGNGTTDSASFASRWLIAVRYANL